MKRTPGNMPKESATGITFLRLRTVLRVVGKSKSDLYRCIAAGTFPKPIKVEVGQSRWVLEDVRKWQEKKIAESKSFSEFDDVLG